MTKRIFRSIILTAALVLLASFVIILGVLYTHYGQQQKNQLESQLSLAAAGVQIGGTDYLSAVEKSSFRLTLIVADGSVLFDSAASASDMENHADREEIKQAFETGKGESERYSATLTEVTTYLAKKLENGSVLRISASRFSVVSLVLGMVEPIIIVSVIAVIISAILAHKISGKIVKPLNSLDLDKPLENNTYEELSPLLTRMEQQYRRIDDQKKNLSRMQSELRSITENMSEGLVLLSEDHKILSINKAAEKLFETDSKCIGTDFLMTDRRREMTEAIETAASSGRSELVISHGGREYQFDITCIEKDGKISGLVMLSFDVTEKIHAERNRREFTANVSHELKTPLTSIMGSAELMENGLVKQEDIPEFSHRIYTESGRLLTLINDIISLSHLDEGTVPEGEGCDIYAVVESVTEALRQAAKAKNVTITLDGEPAMVKGSEKLIRNIVQNLCDNAVKYNKDGGTVKVGVKKTGEIVRFTVSDTGIGIPPEHQARVFERFYRVEKSRSKELGGTGLGLSIVKHAVELLGGEIKMESKVGEGTIINVKLRIFAVTD